MNELEKINAKPALRKLTAAEFQKLEQVPPEVEWFAELTNKNTRDAYVRDVKDFMRFVGIDVPEDFRRVTRAHILAWREDLKKRIVSEDAEGNVSHFSAASIRRKLAAVSSLYQFMCDRNSVTENPAKGVSRPREASRPTDAISDAQARTLLAAPKGDDVKAKRDRAILATFLFHAIRRQELVKLKVRDVHSVRGVPHLRIHGKGDKTRDIPAAPQALELINDYLETAGHLNDKKGALFRPLRNRSTGKLDKPLSPWAVWDIVKGYARQVGLETSMDKFCVHSLRATAITNALDNDADMAHVQEWVGHARIDTTRGYDRRKTRVEDSPTYRVRY